jgi:hypothetical protein
LFKPSDKNSKHFTQAQHVTHAIATIQLDPDQEFVGDSNYSQDPSEKTQTSSCSAGRYVESDWNSAQLHSTKAKRVRLEWWVYHHW